ncbi:hypothetical protein B0H13DRAFT_234961 [Mycena leptocephala]|nr:hypothetical protein B0H13DRAFT_234961 [Mycena leptocephala]
MPKSYAIRDAQTRTQTNDLPRRLVSCSSRYHHRSPFVVHTYSSAPKHIFLPPSPPFSIVFIFIFIFVSASSACPTTPRSITARIARPSPVLRRSTLILPRTRILPPPSPPYPFRAFKLLASKLRPASVQVRDPRQHIRHHDSPLPALNHDLAGRRSCAFLPSSVLPRLPGVPGVLGVPRCRGLTPRALSAAGPPAPRPNSSVKSQLALVPRLGLLARALDPRCLSLARSSTIDLRPSPSILLPPPEVLDIPHSPAHNLLLYSETQPNRQARDQSSNARSRSLLPKVPGSESESRAAEV